MNDDSNTPVTPAPAPEPTELEVYEAMRTINPFAAAEYHLRHLTVISAQRHVRKAAK